MLVFFGLTLFILLLTLSIIDIKSFILPNILTLPLIVMGVLQSWFLTQAWQNSLIGAAAGYGVFVALELGFKKIRGKDGLGRGDAKLLAAGGAWCGWSSLPILILIASTTGLVLALFKFVKTSADKQNTQDTPEENWIPFGPFLAFSIFIVWGYSHIII